MSKKQNSIACDGVIYLELPDREAETVKAKLFMTDMWDVVVVGGSDISGQAASCCQHLARLPCLLAQSYIDAFDEIRSWRRGGSRAASPSQQPQQPQQKESAAKRFAYVEELPPSSAESGARESRARYALVSFLWVDTDSGYEAERVTRRRAITEGELSELIGREASNAEDAAEAGRIHESRSAADVGVLIRRNVRR